MPGAPLKERAFEYRVLYWRSGETRRAKVFKRRKTALAFRDFLLAKSAEEILALRGTPPDEYSCCNGYECGCGGKTNLDYERERWGELPPVERVELQERRVWEWEALSDDAQREARP